MNFNPETLQEETSEERAQRQRQTGVLGNGLHVLCTPTEDPEVTEIQHRISCLSRPYAACSRCRHSSFTLIFNGNPQVRFETVLCPRWKRDGDRVKGEKPSSYVPTELATCSEKPFEYCPSCPSREVLSKLEVDKTKDGWYSRYKRFTQEEDDAD